MAFDPISIGLEIGGKLIDRWFPDPQKAAEAKLEMFKMQQAGEFKGIDIVAANALEQIKVNAVEAAHPNIFVSGGRPAAMWVCVSGLAYTFLIQPLLAWVAAILKYPIPPIIDIAALMQLLLGMLGLAGIRSFEKSRGVASK